MRLDRVIGDGLKLLVEGPWLWLACMPAQPVAWPISAATLRDDDLFSALGRLRPWYDVKLFDRPQRLVGPRRVKLAEHRDRDGRPEWAYAEIHSDGAVFVARDLSVTATPGSSLELPDEYLTAVLTTEMRFVAACAQRVGAFGEAFLGAGITPGSSLTMEIVDVYGAGSTTASGTAADTGARTSMVGVDLDRTPLPAGWAIPAKLIGDELVQHLWACRAATSGQRGSVEGQ